MDLIKKLKRNSGPSTSRASPVGLARFRDRMDSLFNRMRRDLETPRAVFSERGYWPPLDMAVGGKEVTLRLDVPGLGPENVDIQVSGNALTIRGARNEEWTEHRGEVYRRERRFGSFSRTVTLPAYAESDKIDATYDKGILTIRVPCAAGEHVKRIPVKGKGG